MQRFLRYELRDADLVPGLRVPVLHRGVYRWLCSDLVAATKQLSMRDVVKCLKACLFTPALRVAGLTLLQRLRRTAPLCARRREMVRRMRSTLRQMPSRDAHLRTEVAEPARHSLSAMSKAGRGVACCALCAHGRDAFATKRRWDWRFHCGSAYSRVEQWLEFMHAHGYAPATIADLCASASAPSAQPSSTRDASRPERKDAAEVHVAMGRAERVPAPPLPFVLARYLLRAVHSPRRRHMALYIAQSIVRKATSMNAANAAAGAVAGVDLSTTLPPLPDLLAYRLERSSPHHKDAFIYAAYAASKEASIVRTAATFPRRESLTSLADRHWQERVWRQLTGASRRVLRLVGYRA